MWCTVCLICLYQPFVLTVWGENMLFPNSIMILYCIYFFSFQNGNIRFVYTTACGLWWENRYRDLGETLANAILNFILVKRLGVLGILLSTIISNFLFGFIWATTIVFKYYFTGINISEYYKYHLKYWMVTILISAVCFLICNKIYIGSQALKMFVSLILCTIISNFLFFKIFKEEKYMKSLDITSKLRELLSLFSRRRYHAK